MKFKKKPVVVEAINFGEFVRHGIEQCKAEGQESNIINGMPLSFSYNGHPITLVRDDCYLIPTLEGTHNMTPDDMLITGVKGEIYPCKLDIFEATYENAEESTALDLMRVRKAEHGDYSELRKLAMYACSGQPTQGKAPLQIAVDYIAAANPATVLALLDEIDALRAANGTEDTSENKCVVDGVTYVAVERDDGGCRPCAFEWGSEQCISAWLCLPTLRSDGRSIVWARKEASNG